MMEYRDLYDENKLEDYFAKICYNQLNNTKSTYNKLMENNILKCEYKTYGIDNFCNLLAKDITITNDIEKALDGSNAIIVLTSSEKFKEALDNIKPYYKSEWLLIGSKGLYNNDILFEMHDDIVSAKASKKDLLDLKLKSIEDVKIYELKEID